MDSMDLVKAAHSQSASNFENAFAGAMKERISAAIETRRAEVGASMAPKSDE